MNILILNWRDPKNPRSGGAEKLNLHILKPLLERGDSVTWYAVAVKNVPKLETYQGIHIIRFGNPLTHLLAWPFFYWLRKFGDIDFIIDSVHGTGYMSSIIAPHTRKIILICEVAQNIWDEMYQFPINKIGKVWEKGMFWFYRKDRFWTISQSTKKDLVNFGIPSENIEILPMGFDAVKLKTLPAKYKTPTALFVGRLAEMKGIKDAIQAVFETNKDASQKWRLTVIGRGEEGYENELRSLVEKLKMNDYVHFLGFVEEKKKFEEMAKAWVILVPSSREGWGMIVPEANYAGTIAIGYRVAGLKDVLLSYSDENIIIDPNILSLTESLLKIHDPVRVVNKLQPGWDNLYKFILKRRNSFAN